MSHAYSYGHLTYYTAWLKANYPLEFYTSIISNEEDAKQQAFYMEDARRRGINVLPPNVNESDTGFAISSYDDIVYGFSGIKGIGASVYNDLKSLRPFSSLGDFLLRTYMSKSRINKKAYDALIRSGALDTFGYKRSIMIRSYEKFILDFDSDNKIKKAFIASGYVMTAEIKEQIRSHIKNESLYFSDDAMSEYTLLEILEMEKELLGIYITGDPFDVVLKAVKERHFLATDAEIAVGEKGSFSGMIVVKITGNRGIKTKTGKDMCFLSAEDHKGNSFSMTAFDNVYNKSKLIMRNGNYLACYVNAKPSYKNDGTIDYVISSVIDLSEDMKKVSKDISKTKLIKEAVVSISNIPSAVRVRSIVNKVIDICGNPDLNKVTGSIFIDFVVDESDYESDNGIVSDKTYKVRCGPYYVETINVDVIRDLNKIPNAIINTR